ncbi:MAG TPA: TusE/DsrC/DsvC family sulfur relay protein [Nitrospirota bacterium]|jgi:tRNA 2-thiouridine synthesizing protein E
MPALKIEGGSVEVDKNGYLKNINAWNEAVAEAIAKKEGIKKLTDDHIMVVKFLRDYYIKFNSFPLLNMVCTNLHKPKGCATKPFKMDPLKAWKIAGLPEPVEEALSYLEGPTHIQK